MDAASVVTVEEFGGGKVKYPRGRVVFCGGRLGATTYLREHGGARRAIVGGTSTSGDGGTSTSGDGGTSTSGYRGTSTSGDGGTIGIRWWDWSAERYRTAVGYVGENGIEPGVAYRLDDEHRFVAAETNRLAEQLAAVRP